MRKTIVYSIPTTLLVYTEYEKWCPRFLILNPKTLHVPIQFIALRTHTSMSAKMYTPKDKAFINGYSNLTNGFHGPTRRVHFKSI